MKLRNVMSVSFMVGLIAIVVLAASEPLPVLPTSDSTIRCVVNLDQFALGHLSKWSDVPLITDVSVKLTQGFPDSTASPVQHLRELQEISPHVGTYISGGRIDNVQKQHPPATISFTHAPPDWVVEGALRFRLDGVGVAGAVAKAIADEVYDRPAQIVFLDNVIHPSTGGAVSSWFHSCRFLRMLRDRLHNQGKRLIANVSVAPWFMSEADVDLLGGSVDGIALEMAFHSNIRDRPDRMAKEIAHHRQWLDAGLTVICIPVADDLDAEADYLAQQVLANRKDGDRWWVSFPYWKNKPDWMKNREDDGR